MTDMTPAERRRKKLRTHIIANATALYKKHGGGNGGFENTSVEEIAQISDISLRTFFRYFETKMDVIYLDIKNARADLADFIHNRPAEEGRLEAVLNARFEQVDFFLNDKDNRERLLRSLKALQFQSRLLVLRNELKGCIFEALTQETGRSEPLTVDYARMISNILIDIIGDVMDDWAHDTSIDIQARSKELFKSLPDLVNSLSHTVGN